ncbi:hypothetical protein ACIQXW_23285 [Lysinibacillus sp. NPDC097162]|uniref:hypothetical protein n=1 Tax=Lysinibacillus sp. NPDC097162 TaxID=3364140 RepID=UPI0037FC4AA3
MDNLIIVYENVSVMSYLRQKVDEVSNVITDVDKLETRIYAQLVSYFSLGKSSFRRAQKLIDREVSQALKQFGKQKAINFSELAKGNDFGESVEFEPKDLLAQGGETVIQNISLNEKIARLATDDRESVTLNAWANGFNDTQVSETLASHFGGNKESHRKFVRRFKARCQERLEKECLAKNLLIKTA